MTFQSTHSFNWNSFPKSFCQHNTFTNKKKKKLLHSQNYSLSQRHTTVKDKRINYHTRFTLSNTHWS